MLAGNLSNISVAASQFNRLLNVCQKLLARKPLLDRICKYLLECARWFGHSCCLLV